MIVHPTSRLFLVFLAAASNPAAADVISACSRTQIGGYIRLVTDVLQCTEEEIPLEWNSEGPPGPPAPGQIAFEFVGFSSTSVDGASGLLVLNQACQADFGPSARISTSAELLATSSLTPQGSGTAWVKSSIVAVLSGISPPVALDMSGAELELGDGIDCDGWSSPAGSSLLIEGQTMSFSSQSSCSGSRRVACAIPRSGEEQQQ